MIQFNSVWQTMVTMSAILLILHELGLVIMERPFGIVMSGLGIIALAGIVVNNNIVLIDTYNEYRRRGYVRVSVFTLLGLFPSCLTDSYHDDLACRYRYMMTICLPTERYFLVRQVPNGGQIYLAQLQAG